MKSSWFSVGSLCWRRFLRILLAYVVLFAIHQVFTLPLFTALLRFGMEENPVSSILETRSFVEQYENMTGAEPSSLAETRAPRADEFVLTTGAQYAPLRERYDGMILAEKRPRRRTLVPFPMGTWGVYAVKPKSCDYGVRIVQSDWETRRLYAFIAKQEGGGFNFAASFVLDALIYAFWFAAALFYVYLQTRKRRAEATTFGRFERFRDACFAFRDQTGRFPNSLEDLGAEDASEFRDAFRRREFLFLSTLGVGVVAATAKSWRAPFAPVVFGRRTLVALEDGSIVKVRGRRTVNLFYDVLRTARKQENVGRFYVAKNKLKFEENKLPVRRAAIVGYALTAATLLIVWATFLAFIVRADGVREFSDFIVSAIGALIFTTCIALGIVPLEYFNLLGGVYAFIAHTVWGWI